MGMNAAVVAALLSLAVMRPAAAESTAEIFGRSTACALHCSAPSTFQYTKGMVHVFDYHASAKFLSNGREPQLGVSARAHITIAGPCEMILALSHVRLTDSSEPHPEFAAALTDKPLRFGFDDGRVSAVCPATDEPLWVLNFKRALLSTFQNSMKDFEKTRPVISEEIDVSGKCVSNYTAVIDPSGVVNVTRVRAESCEAPPLPASPSTCTTLLRLLPVFERQQKCLQIISSGSLKEAICRENIRYPRFFGGDDDQPIASLTTRLKLSYQFKADFVVVPNSEARRSTLAMEWESGEPGDPPPQWLSIASEIITRLKNYAPDPVAFYRLTELLKTLDYDRLRELFLSIEPETWEMATVSFINLGTEASMKLLQDFMDSGGLPWNLRGDTIHNLLENFGLTSEMINILLKFIESSSLDKQFVSNKLKNYCLKNAECEQDERISKLFSKSIEENSTPECKLDNETDTSEVASDGYDSSQSPGFGYLNQLNVEKLENFASLGRWNESSDNALLNCSQSVHQREWYGALEALRSARCADFDYNSLLSIAEENKEDSFRQIMIYRTLVRCPSDEFKSYILKRLTKDEVNQVTSYIWTHLTNLKNEGWATELVKNAALVSKFREKSLKFSRNVRKSFFVKKKTYDFEFNTIFSGFSLRPQYLSFQIFSDDFTPSEIWGLELREVNQTVETRDYYDEVRKTETSTVCAIDMRILGNNVYSKEKSFEDASFGLSSDYLVGTVVEYGTRMFDIFSFSFLARLFQINSFDVEYFKHLDIDLYFPTSLGLPFHLKLNKTKGYHVENLAPAYGKQFDAAMYIDAHHTNVGSKMITRFDLLPGLNVSKHLDRYQLIIKLPHLKNSIANIEMGVYNIENDKLTPRFSNNESLLETICIPGLQNISGSTVCIEYCPKTSWWPIYNFKYNLIYDKQEKVQGYNISGRFDSTFVDVAYEVMGCPDSSWRVQVYDLAEFLNIKLETPFFALNGSGIYKPKVAGFEHFGQALNMSGTLRCNDDEAPFTLIAESKKGQDKNMNVNLYFDSRLFESKLLSSVGFGNNGSAVVTIPYKIKGKTVETINFALSGSESNKVEESRIKLPFSVPSNFTRQEATAYVTFSQFPEFVIDFKGVCEDDKGDLDLDYYSWDFKLACGSHSLTSIMSTLWSRKTFETNSTLVYNKPDKVWKCEKHAFSEDGQHRGWTVISCNDDLMLQAQGECGVSKERGMYSNSSLVVPSHQPDAKYPLMTVTFDHNFNVLAQHYHVYCKKSFRDKTLQLNFTSDVVLDDRGVPQGFAESASHTGFLEISGSSIDPFLVTTDSKLSKSLQDLELTAVVQTPFDRWDKEAFKLKLQKRGDYLQSTLTENRRHESDSVYEVEGSLDHDIISNVLDWTSLKRKA